MKVVSWSTALVASISLLVAIVAGGRLSEISQRRGYTQNMIDDLKARSFEKRTVSGEKRFFNSETEKYFVESMPDIPQHFMTEMYAGLMPIDMANSSRALYFVYQPKIGDPVDEITIWLNGGPGCSSLEGFFQENGRIQWSWGQWSPTINDYAWVNLTNVLWVEQPVGTGFSIGDVRATSQEDIGEDFADFLLNFQTTFGIKNFKIYVTGESYAGRYVPYIMNSMLDRQNETYFDVSGGLVYDPCIGSYVYAQQQAVAFPYVSKYNNVLGFNSSFMNTMEELDKSCGYADFRDQYLVYPPSGTQPPKYFNYTSETECAVWDISYLEAYHTNPCFNVYEVGLQCPLQSDPLGYPTGLLYSYDGLPVYFNRTDVKEAMHAPTSVSWSECSGPVFLGEGGPEDEGDLSPDPIQWVLPRVLEATNRVLVSNGALDMEIITNGTLLAIQNMTWGGMMGFQSEPSKPINIKLPDLQYQEVFADNGFEGGEEPQGIMGIQHYERGLMWAETYLAGHMQPQFQGRSAYRHLQWVLGRIEEL